MTRHEFLKAIDEILELQPGTVLGSEKLEDFPLWDSTAMISFMALADTNNGIRIAPRELGSCETISDLLQIAKVEG